MTNEAQETTFVCGDCLVQVENFEGSADSMKNLPGDWYYIGHGWEVEDLKECKMCNGEINYICEYADGERSPSWVCPGCGVTGIMFNDTYMIEKAD